MDTKSSEKATTSAKHLTDEHKQALARGREEGRIVRQYLEVVTVPKKRGRKRTLESMKRRLQEIEKELPEASGVELLDLVQQRMDLLKEISVMENVSKPLAELEEAFIKVAASYSKRKGYSRAAWREVGVPASVLNKAGIK